MDRDVEVVEGGESVNTWKTGLIVGLGGAVFLVDSEVGDAYMVRNVTVVLADGQVGQKPTPLIAPYPIEVFGCADGAMRLDKSQVTLTAGASPEIIKVAEQAWASPAGV